VVGPVVQTITPSTFTVQVTTPFANATTSALPSATFTVTSAASPGQVVFDQYVHAVNRAVGQTFGEDFLVGVQGGATAFYRRNEAATRRARELLEHVLRPDELRKWDADHYLDIPSKLRAGRVYRLEDSPWEPRIKVLKDGVKFASVCLHVGEDLPKDDVVVGKYLLARFDEEEIERVGNWTLYDARSGRVNWAAVEDRFAVALEAA
jgi:hypothetical protein